VEKLKEKIAVITGGSSGIGLATASLFAREGAHVFIMGRRQKELDEGARLIGENGTAIRGDISVSADLDRLFAAVKSTKGRIDILFANAGLGERGVIGEVTKEHFDRVFGVNVKGMFFTVQKALLCSRRARR
jgi:NAD(P)-dependent dehydrogenase (short-subunit alcohol dehydrogenase family)